MLALPVSDEVERLQRRDDVLGLDGCHLTHVLDRDVAPMFAQDIKEHLRPVTPEAEEPEIRQRLLWRTHLQMIQNPDMIYFPIHSLTLLSFLDNS